jgi:hypothetical protein
MALTDEDKQWLEKLITSELAILDTNLNPRFAVLASGVKDQLDAMETRLLADFRKETPSNDDKRRQFSAALRSLEIQFEALDDRVRKLEGRT